MITMHSESMKEIATALSKAQKEMSNVKSEAENPYFKSKYADLASIWDSVREPLTNNGLSLAQIFLYEDGQQFLVTQLTHTSGEYLRSMILFAPTKNDPQALGSYSSYLRRYSMNAMLGIAQFDDDAESAMIRTPATQPALEAKPQPKKHVGGTDYAKTWAQVDLANKTFGEDHKKFPNKQYKEVITTQEGVSYALWIKNQIEMKNDKLPKYLLEFYEYARPFVTAEFGSKQ